LKSTLDLYEAFVLAKRSDHAVISWRIHYVRQCDACDSWTIDRQTDTLIIIIIIIIATIS
jgi:hypothetical protein